MRRIGKMENLGGRFCLHNGLSGGLFIKVGFLRVAVGFQESRPGGNAPLPFMGRTFDKGRFRFRFRFFF